MEMVNTEYESYSRIWIQVHEYEYFSNGWRNLVILTIKQ